MPKGTEGSRGPVSAVGQSSEAAEIDSRSREVAREGEILEDRKRR